MTAAPLSPDQRAGSPSGAILFGLCMVAAVVFIAVFAATPRTIAPSAPYDDGLFMSHAQALAEGHWLGPYDKFTLIKGPGYPLFLAAGYFSGLPVSVAEAVFFALSLGIFALAVGRLSKMPLLATAIFILALFHPIFLTQRIVRDGVYAGQVFLVGGALIFALFTARSATARVLWSILTGLALGWLWLTREEGVWLLPALFFLFVIAAFRFRRERLFLRVALPLVLAALCFGALQSGFAWGNRVAYGSFVGLDIKERNFERAMAALQSVRDGDQIDFVPVSHATRARIYAVSPTFASLQIYFDPPGGSPWQYGCQFYPATCGDIAGGWFIWALRDGAFRIGHFTTPVEASTFFGRIADEVDAACRSGALHCAWGAFAYLPRISMTQIRALPASIGKGLALLSLSRPVTRLMPAPSDGSAADIEAAVAFLNHPTYAPLEAKAPARLSDIFNSGFGSLTGTAKPVPDPRARLSLAIRAWVTRAYGRVMPLALPLGALAFVGALILAWLRSRGDMTLMLAGTAWLLVVSRLGLLALIDISAFPAMDGLYLLPALYLSVPAICLSFVSLVCPLLPAADAHPPAGLTIARSPGSDREAA